MAVGKAVIVFLNINPKDMFNEWKLDLRVVVYRTSACDGICIHPPPH